MKRSDHKTTPASPRPATARGEATRKKLLRAAEREIGGEGFHRASVSGITRAAGVAQGTFYLYFPSKEEALRELVQHMGRELRQELTRAIEPAATRMQAERQGLEAFLRFVAEHQNLYRVVQEALFVDEAVYREYYQNLAKGYSARLKSAQDGGELRPGDTEVRAWALMGLGHFLGLRFGLWNTAAPSAQVLDAAMDFIAHGIAPTTAEDSETQGSAP